MFILQDNIKEIKYVASSIVKKWGNIFEADELVNEAWLGCGHIEFSSINGLRKAARCDMIDYIRMIVGRKGNGRKYKNGTIVKDRIKMIGKTFTNTIDTELQPGEKNLFEGQSIDSRFKQIDDQEFIDDIFDKISISKKEKNILERRYMHDAQPIQIREETGVETTSINYLLRKNLKNLVQHGKIVMDNWEETHKELIVI